jgi:3-oxoacyl-[acyl-carrier-protein] synthase II
MNKRKVVVTGLGMATSLGLDVETSWQKALAGTTGIKKISYPETSKSAIQAVGEVSGKDWEQIQSKFKGEAAAEGERRTLFALWAAGAALEDAGFRTAPDNGYRCGIAVAAGLGINRPEDMSTWITSDRTFDYKKFGREYARLHRESIARNNSNRPAALIAHNYNFHGFNSTITTACASASQAIGTAFRAIRRGDADVMVTGGADSMINPVGLVFFVLLGAAATSRENPEEVCRPFDRKRSGLVMGEGSGIAVLEEESHALKRGARVYAEVAGYGSTMDAHQVTAPHPKGVGAEGSMRSVLSDADMAGEDIDYINAHGTSTKLNDAAETLAIKNVFREHAANICINSSKSLIGHLLAASGGPEFVFTTLTVNRDEIHPTMNLNNRDPKCDLDYVPNVKREKTVRAAITNSFGFGGQNASIVLKKYVRES